MILVLNGADFSEANIGQIEIPRELDDFTKAAIVASGNSSMTDEQKMALDTFFRSIGAIDGSGVFAKLKYLYMPVLANTVSYALVNYKNNSGALVPSATNWQLRNHGIVASQQDGVDDLIVNDSFDENDISIFAYNMETLYNASNVISPVMKIGNNNPGRFSVDVRTNGNGNTMYILHKDENTQVAACATESLRVSTFGGVSIYGTGDNNISFFNIDGTIRKFTGSLTDATYSELHLLSSIAFQPSNEFSSLGMIVVGSHLSDDEMLAFRTAANKFVTDFL